MGTWGPGIFSNDTAADARLNWRDGLGDGWDPARLTRDLIAREFLTGGPDDTQFVTGLAAAQWETGHLQDEVRDRALAVIAAGGDLEAWGSSSGPRRRCLERLAVKLQGPMPAPKRPRRRPGPVDPGVREGDVLRIHRDDGGALPLWLVRRVSLNGRQYMIWLLALRWAEVDPPPRDEMTRLPYLAHADGDESRYLGERAKLLDAAAREHGFELPRMPAMPEGARPVEVTVVADPATAFGPKLGEIVARDLDWIGAFPEREKINGYDGPWNATMWHQMRTWPNQSALAAMLAASET